MAQVTKKSRAGKTDPFGTGKILVSDCLDGFSNEELDPFLMLHAFGPTDIKNMPQFGMHPHRGFNEVPYLKRGRWIATDPWNMDGVGDDAVFAEGQLQWGKSGMGIEHGMKFDPTYSGPVMGFQCWINLPSAKKLDPPEFQNARADALPLLEPAPRVKAKLLVGELCGKSSPVETHGISCQYVDYMLEPNAEVTHPRPGGMSALFVYVYEGAGAFGSSGVSAQEGEAMSFGSTGDVLLKAGGGGLGCVVLAGAPLREPVIQHGPFVMSSRAQIMQAFPNPSPHPHPHPHPNPNLHPNPNPNPHPHPNPHPNHGRIMQAFEDFQRGRFLAKQCTYKLHTGSGTVESKRDIDPNYASRSR